MQAADATLLQLARGALLADDPADSVLAALDLDDPQQRRFGDYELLQRLGRGGMGVVFRARQLSLQREVALKVIAGLGEDAAAVARFLGEARAAAQLHHPHIVPVYEVGLIGDVHFFSMPLAASTLATQLDGRALAPAAALELMLQLAGAVGYAHSLGLLHLDLKPDNVLLDEQGRAQIADFGLALAFDPQRLAPAQEISGTPAYMAPEQRDPALGPLGPASDVYALGAMLLQFLGGRLPDAAGRDALLAGLDADLGAICRHCLNEDPRRRYASVAEFATDLARARDGNAVSVRPRRWAERAWRGLRRHPALSLAVAAALLALCAGLAATAWQWQRAQAALAAAETARQQSSARAERLRQLAGLMAASFPSGSASEAQRRAGAEAAVAWLRRETADPAAQRELLDAFGQALRSAGKDDAVETLLAEIIRQLGQDYRRAQLQQLIARGDRDSLIAAVLLSSTQPEQAGLAAQARTQLRQGHPGDVAALSALALACHVQNNNCEEIQDFRNLTRLAPDNAVHWVLWPQGLAESERALARRLAQAAAATTFDDHAASQAALLQRMLQKPPLPESLRQPLQAVLDPADMAASLRRTAVDAVPLPRYADFVRLCRPDYGALARQPGLREHCIAFAQRGLTAPGAAVLSRMVASAMLRRLYKGRPEAGPAYAARRQYVWLAEQFTRRRIDPEQLRQDFARYGEWQAMERMAQRHGIAATPPADWQPQDPKMLLLSEDR
ncbi:serine/threonine-protein kinase [Tahibacter harae]|uniref:Serine/threonine protein kinase n=1 Tax=Tahibacter harae TaxID=2963937 RepID=A0ABT1QLC3_9GAMM|nr:serine/threonine-protein kinase [Tahibacter harae]MCQ4163324.1 serine/threonine protein kinase [Tahibacter harae]